MEIWELLAWGLAGVYVVSLVVGSFALAFMQGYAYTKVYDAGGVGAMAIDLILWPIQLLAFIVFSPWTLTSKLGRKLAERRWEKERQARLKAKEQQ